MIYGTTAEAIKFAPIYSRLAAFNLRVEQWVTLQQAQTVLDALPLLGMPLPDRIISNGVNGRPLSSALDTARWLGAITWWTLRHSRELRTALRQEPSVILVHGDTLTSVVGAIIAKFLGVPSAHVEAGLRSGNWRHPFPEELDRRIVGKLAAIHYAPSGEAVSALEERTNVIFTHGNTAIDSLVDAIDTRKAENEAPYGLVLLHRFEFLNNHQLVTETFDALAASTTLPLTVVADDHAHHVVSEQIARLQAKNITLVGKQTHPDFVKLAVNASFVVTDSGGVQEEMGFLGIPTLIHRKATERSDGLGRNVVLSDWSMTSLESFLKDYQRLSFPRLELEKSPSDIIVSDLRERGYGN